MDERAHWISSTSRWQIQKTRERRKEPGQKEGGLKPDEKSEKASKKQKKEKKKVVRRGRSMTNPGMEMSPMVEKREMSKSSTLQDLVSTLRIGSLSRIVDSG